MSQQSRQYTLSIQAMLLINLLTMNFLSGCIVQEPMEPLNISIESSHDQEDEGSEPETSETETSKPETSETETSETETNETETSETETNETETSTSTFSTNTGAVEWDMFLATYYDESYSTTEYIATERVERPSMNYVWDDLLNINSEDFYAVWTGELQADGATTIDITVDYSWSDVSIYIDDNLVLQDRERVSVDLADGSHSVRVELHNNWHTVGFNVDFSVSQSRQELEPMMIQSEDFKAVMVYEAGSANRHDNVIEVEIGPGETPVFILLSSYAGINWQIINPTQREIEGIVVCSFSESTNIIGLGETPVYYHGNEYYGESEELQYMTEQYFQRQPSSIIDHYELDYAYIE